MEKTTEEPTKHSVAQRIKSSRRSYLWLFVAGVITAFVATTAVRYALITDPSIHYHANFALYINGSKDEFKSFTFYEEVAACDAHSQDNPKVRTHMHDQKNHLIHVHDGGVTWGQFFANLGYTLGDDLVQTDNGSYITGDDGNKLTFVLNGKPATTISNQLISSEDALLINYGKDNQSTLDQRYGAISRDAGQANLTKDPAACSGGNELTFWSRLTQALGIPDDSH